MNSIVDSIISEKLPCYFISPHLDDALLSSGGLVSYLAGKVPVTIITVFTEGSSGPYTISAKQFLKQCGFSNSLDLFRHRKIEDINACNKAGVKYIHLGFVDALFRKKDINPSILGKLIPELYHTNPTYRFHVVKGKIKKQDSFLSIKIAKTLKNILPHDGRYAMFGPMAQGNHIDHRIVRNVCSSIDKNVIWWLDFPYCVREDVKVKELPRFSWDCEENLELKKQIIECYDSQVKAMFGNNAINFVEEVYY